MIQNQDSTPIPREMPTYDSQTINRAFNEFLRLRELDRKLLAHYQEVLQQGDERFALTFYDYLLAFPATAEVLEKFRERGGKIQDLVRRQVEHLLALLAGDTGEESARRVAEIGEIHHRHGIEPVWILGAYLLYLNHLRAVIRTSPRIEDVHRAALEDNIIKLLFRDMGLALEGYWVSNLGDLQQEKTRVSELQAQITSLLSNIPQLLWSVDVVTNRALYISPSANEICQTDIDLPIPCLGWTIPEDREIVNLAWQKALTGRRADVESRVRRPNGEVRWFRRVFYPFTNAEGKVVRIDGLMEDTTDAKEMIQKLHTLATTDALTGLPNRALFQDRFTQAIAAARRGGNREIVLMHIDLDRFKEINDTLGYPAGDRILCMIAQRLGAVLRDTDTLARLGGDEFVILLPDVRDGRKTAEKSIKRVMDCFSTPFQLGDNELFLGAGIGIVIYPEHGEEAAILLSRAGVAMYGTKNRDGGYLFYDATLDTNIPQHLQLSGELRHAIERQELMLHYQPKIDFRTKRATGAEALIRWDHPQLGLLAPDRFIALAERTGFIRTITYWVIDTALRQCKAWRDAGLSLRVAVNVPGRALRDPTFFKRVRQILREVDIPASSLEIEITENTLMSDVERVHVRLSQLADLGIRITIDDFGTGYSSLAMLKKLPLHTIKIDKSFVLNMTKDENDAVIVRSTIELGHNLGCTLVAEGIENHETWELLSVLGCDDAQGFHISRALAPEQFSRWLEESPWGPVLSMPR